MEINSINNTSFGAKIVPSRALNKALELAKADALSGVAERKENAARFYNSLRTIEKDSSTNIFYVKGPSAKFYPHIKLDKDIRLLEFIGKNRGNVGLTIQDSINKFVHGKYYRTEISNEAKKANLAKAFDKWLA